MIVLKDRVQAPSVSFGLSDLELGPAPSGFQSFAAIGDGNETYYCVSDSSGNWEVGIGTYELANNVLSRDTVLSSSTGGAKVDFPLGTKTVICTLPAEKLPLTAPNSNILHNTSFSVQQRGISSGTYSANQFSLDRWKGGASGVTYTRTGEYPQNLTVNITAGSLKQVCELPAGYKPDLILTWEGTAQGKIQSGSYGSSGVTATVSGVSQVSVEFTGGTVKNPKLEYGTTPTIYQGQSYQQELEQCYRYFYRLQNCSLDGSFYTPNYCLVSVPLKVQMYSNANLTVTNPSSSTITYNGTNINPSGCSIWTYSSVQPGIYFNTSGATQGAAAFITMSGTILDFSAEI